MHRRSFTMKIKSSDILLSVLALVAVLLANNDISVVRSKGNVDGYPYPDPSLIVTNTNDSGAGSLRQTISDSMSGDKITFAPSLSGQTIRLSSTLSIDKNLILDGSTLNQNIKINGDTNNNQYGDVRVFSIAQGITVEFLSIDIEYGNYSGGGAIGGGGILNKGNLTISDCSIDNNRANYGGGIYNYLNATSTISNCIFTNNVGSAISNIGLLYVTNSTFSNNSNTGNGSAVQAGGETIIKNSTFNNNSGGSGALYHTSVLSLRSENNTFRSNSPYAIYNYDGDAEIINNTIYGNLGGIFVFSDYVSISNSIVSHNSYNGNPKDCFIYESVSYPRGVSLDDHNYFSSDTNCGVYVSGYGVLLDNSLEDNGGPTQTLALMHDSPAVDAGNDASCLAYDQRGIARPEGEHCDIGAFEYVVTPENDNFNYPKDISSLPYEDETDTTYATVSGDDPEIGLCSISGSGVSTVWYKYEPATDTAISINTFESDYDTFIAIWKGTDLNDLRFVACNDDTGGTKQSEVAIRVTGGKAYYIEIGQP